MKLMIIEDNADLRQLNSQLFQTAGYEVAASADGLNGVSDAVDFQPDIILLDLLMPEMDGYDFLKVLHDNTSMRPVIIVCSNLSQQTDIDRAMANGADAYLCKSDYIGDSLIQAVQAEYTAALARRS